MADNAIMKSHMSKQLRVSARVVLISLAQDYTHHLISLVQDYIDLESTKG